MFLSCAAQLPRMRAFTHPRELSDGCALLTAMKCCVQIPSISLVHGSFAVNQSDRRQSADHVAEWLCVGTVSQADDVVLLAPCASKSTQIHTVSVSMLRKPNLSVSVNLPIKIEKT